jgi:hypothetical protein
MSLSLIKRLVLAVTFLFVLMVNGCGTFVTLQEDADYDCRGNLIIQAQYVRFKIMDIHFSYTFFPYR